MQWAFEVLLAAAGASRSIEVSERVLSTWRAEARRRTQSPPAHTAYAPRPRTARVNVAAGAPSGGRYGWRRNSGLRFMLESLT